jgi:hypothetical protein
MNRRNWIGSLASLALGGSLGWAGFAWADSEMADLEETLKFGLKCRRPEEFDFVELVVQKVNMGQLPRDLVLSQFNWARKQRPKIPFPYFQFGIRKRAEALGVDL